MLSSTDDFPELCIRFQTLDKIKPNSLRSYKPQSKKTKIKKKGPGHRQRQQREEPPKV